MILVLAGIISLVCSGRKPSFGTLFGSKLDHPQVFFITLKEMQNQGIIMK